MCAFLQKVDKRTRRLLRCKLGMREINEEAFYLGNPMFLEKNKMKAFEFLKDKIEKRLAAWWGKLLSFTGRVTLVKSVIFALLLYSCLQ